MDLSPRNLVLSLMRKTILWFVRHSTRVVCLGFSLWAIVRLRSSQSLKLWRWVVLLLQVLLGRWARGNSEAGRTVQWKSLLLGYVYDHQRVGLKM
jgi:hypothetical protein